MPVQVVLRDVQHSGRCRLKTFAAVELEAGQFQDPHLRQGAGHRVQHFWCDHRQHHGIIFCIGALIGREFNALFVTRLDNRFRGSCRHSLCRRWHDFLCSFLGGFLCLLLGQLLGPLSHQGMRLRQGLGHGVQQGWANVAGHFDSFASTLHQLTGQRRHGGLAVGARDRQHLGRIAEFVFQILQSGGKQAQLAALPQANGFGCIHHRGHHFG